MIAALALMAPRQAAAAPILTLSSPGSLANLEVGDVIQIDVNLSGMPGALFDELFALYSEVLFAASLFDPVSGPTAGGILPLPTQQTHFDALSSLTDGSVLGIFNLNLSPSAGDSITLNGVYYSFTLMATAVGTGLIGFDPADTYYTSKSSIFTSVPMPTGGPLAFSITADTAPVPVPEPASLLLMGVGLASAGVRRWRQNR